MSQTESDQLASIIGFGIVVGAVAGILAGIFTGVDVSNTLGYGVGGGILTSAFISTVVQRTDISDTIVNLTALGLVS